MRLWLCLLVLLGATPAAAQGIPARVRAYLETQAQEGFSGAVLVARRGRVLERAYGLADREWNRPNTP